MSAAAARNDDLYDQVAPAAPRVAPPSRTRRVRRLVPSPAPARRPSSRPRRVAQQPVPVAPPRPVAAPRAPFVVLVLALVAAGIVGLLVLNTRINENSFQLEALRERQAALDVQEQELNSTLAQKEASGNLRAEAKRLGMVPAEKHALLNLPDGTVIGVPGPGKAGTDRGE